MLGLRRFRSLVRGVSNHGPPHPSRRALRDDCVSREAHYLRPPQDERINGRTISIHFQREPL